ncbi:MAG: 50S ribosomal protein L13 [Mycoplasmataceae bacterium CE_OT135]|nr:MAG: 50S ribosomal protein L13 [Mycoplasmataceae bacterium CE_OT135]
MNASKVKFTGNKLNNKYYYNHSGYPGGLRKRNTKVMLEKHPTELMERIIWGMMPKNKLSRRQMKRLFVFPSEEHNLQAQEKNFVKINI